MNNLSIIIKFVKKISTIKNKDIEEFIKLWNQDYEILTSSGFKMDYKKAKDGFDKKLFDYYGLYQNKKLVAFLLMKEESDNLWLKHILVDKERRRQGLGTLLLARACKISEHKNLKLKAEVVRKNKTAKKFFLLNEFEIIEENEDEFILEFF